MTDWREGCAVPAAPAQHNWREGCAVLCRLRLHRVTEWREGCAVLCRLRRASWSRVAFRPVAQHCARRVGRGCAAAPCEVALPPPPAWIWEAPQEAAAVPRGLGPRGSPGRRRRFARTDTRRRLDILVEVM